jgi:hypothetical protein
MKKKYSESIKNLASVQDWHFNASHASAQDLDNFRIEDMATEMKKLAPDLWFILDVLLMGDRKRGNLDQEGDQIMSAPHDDMEGEDFIGDEEDELWNTVDNMGFGISEAPASEAEVPAISKKVARREAISTVVSTKKYFSGCNKTYL